MIKYIVAGSHTQYMSYIYEHKLNAYECRFVHSPQYLKGLENPEVIFIGTWECRPDAKEIENVVKSRIRIAK